MFINNVLINNMGCYVNRCCVSCIMYADDLMLLSSCLWASEITLDVSVMTARELCTSENKASLLHHKSV